jgi:hypothetical protein
MHSSECLNHFNVSYNVIVNIFSIYSCSNDDVMDIRGESGFAKFLSVDEFIKLLSQKPKRKAKLPEGWRDIIEEYYKVQNPIVCICCLQELFIGYIIL